MRKAGHSCKCTYDPSAREGGYRGDCCGLLAASLAPDSMKDLVSEEKVESDGIDTEHPPGLRMHAGPYCHTDVGAYTTPTYTTLFHIYTVGPFYS